MSLEPIRYGIVALGRAGWDIHVKSLRDRADARIVVCADPIPERREQAEAELGCRTCKTLSQLLKFDDVDVVVIATPSAQHARDTKKALAAGKHVICEKPMALSLAETDSVIKAARISGRQLFIHQNYRFGAEFNHLRETIDSGILGRVYHIRYYQGNFARRNDWQTLARNGGGTLNNTCPHYIDICIQLIGSAVASVFGDLQQIASAGDVEDHVKIVMRGENGVTADIEISSAQSLAARLPKWIVCGTHGTLSCDGKQSTIRYLDPAQLAPLEAIDGAVAARKYGNGEQLPWQEKLVLVEDRADKRTFYDNVTEVLRDGKQMRVTLDHARELMRVIALARKGTKFPGKPKRAALVPSPGTPGEG